MDPRPSSVEQLLVQTVVNIDSASYNFKMWCRSAINLHEQGQEALSNNDKEMSYVKLMKALIITTEIVPKTKDFNPQEANYKELRRKVESSLETLEGLKSQIDSRFKEWQARNPDKSSRNVQVFSNPVHTQNASRKSPPVPIRTSSSLKNLSLINPISSTSATSPSLNEITASNLFNILDKSASHILILDIRPIKEHMDGHLKWNKMNASSQVPVPSGVVPLEPDFLSIPHTSSNDLESFISAFNSTSHTAKILFSARDKVDLIVMHDADSESIQPSFTKLYKLIYEFEFEKIPIQAPLYLKGGFKSWRSFIHSQPSLNPNDWIDYGIQKRGSLVPSPVESNLEISRTSVDYISRFAKLKIGSRKPSTSSVPATSLTPAVESLTAGGPPLTVPAPVLSPLPTTTSESVLSASRRFPSLEYMDKELNLSPNTSLEPPIPRRTSRFDDPFYAFQRVNSMYPDLETIQQTNQPQPQYNYPELPKPIVPLPPPILPRSSSKDVLYQANVAPIRQFPNSSSSLPLQTSAILPTKPIQPASIPTIQHSTASFANTLPMYKPSAPLIPEKSYVESSLTPNTLSDNPILPIQSLENQFQKLARPVYDFSSQSIHPRPIQQPQPEPIQLPLKPLKSLSRHQNAPPPIPPKPKSPASLTSSLSLDRITLSQITTSEIGIAGLKNLGNTCFLNSIIQCLSGTMPLARYFLDGSYRKHINRHNPLGSKGVIAESYAELIKSMWSEEEVVVVPTKFKQAIGRYAPSFQGNEQQDSQEFLAFILDSLHEDLNLARRKDVKPLTEKESDSDGIPDHILLEKEWLKYRQLNWSIIVDLFQGLLRSQLKCLSCGKVSTTFNPFMYLSLPIPEYNKVNQKGGAVYLEECLDKFIEEETLDGEDAWNCPRCKSKKKSVKKLTIARLPIILLIHFKRFYFKGPFRNKIETYIDFPTQKLDLSFHVNLAKTVESPISPVYDLYAVSNHFGGLNGGHYTAQVRNGYKNQWNNFDDSRVGNCDEKYVKSKAAYILFYVQEGAKPNTNWWS